MRAQAALVRTVAGLRADRLAAALCTKRRVSTTNAPRDCAVAADLHHAGRQLGGGCEKSSPSFENYAVYRNNKYTLIILINLET